MRPGAEAPGEVSRVLPLATRCSRFHEAPAARPGGNAAMLYQAVSYRRGRSVSKVSGSNEPNFFGSGNAGSIT